MASTLAQGPCLSLKKTHFIISMNDKKFFREPTLDEVRLCLSLLGGRQDPSLEHLAISNSGAFLGDDNQLLATVLML